MFGKRFATAAAVLLLLSAAACTGSEATTDEPAADSEEPVATLGTLPAEPGYVWEMARYEGTDPLQVSMSGAGPWVFPSAEGWTVTTSEIVDPEAVASSLRELWR
ncbi:hypothetical protein EG835_08225, partial [bacterium]|nr:hypothetical protein [bacterium]